MEIPHELELFIAKMNKECVGGGTWTYDTFDYTKDEVTTNYSRCREKFHMCDNCVKNVLTYVEKCKPHASKMDIIIHIEKLEKIRTDLLNKVEEMTLDIFLLKAQL